MTVSSFTPVEVLQLRMSSEQPERTGSLEAFYDSCNGNLWRSRYQQMNMVVMPNLHTVDGKPILACDVFEDLLYFLFKLNGHPLVTVLASPYDMVVNVIYTSSTMRITKYLVSHISIIS